MEAQVLTAMGQVHDVGNRYQQAIEHHQAALAIATRIDAQAEMGYALLGIGNAEHSRGDYRTSIESLQQALAIGREIDHVQLQAYAAGNIGSGYERLGEYGSALSYELQSLALKEELGDRWGAGVSMNNIGIIYKGIGDYPGALDYLLRSLATAVEIGDRYGEMAALHNIGLVYEALGESRLVIDNYQRVLSIAESIGDSYGQALSFGSIGRYQLAHGDHRQALLYLTRALRLHQELGDRFGERSALENLAVLYREQKRFDRAAECIESARAIAEESGDVRSVIAALMESARLALQMGNGVEAVALDEQALRLARDGGFMDDLRKVTSQLADTCTAIGDDLRARHYARMYREHLQRLFDCEAARRVRQYITSFEQDRIRRQALEFGLQAEEIEDLSRIDFAADFPLLDQVRRSQQVDEMATPQDRRIEVGTFGELRVSVDGVELQQNVWGRKKARDLFKFLLLHHRRTVTLDEIMEKLWHGASDRSTELVVMNSVSRIRRALEPGRNPRDRHSVLTSSNRTYRLDLGEEAEIDFVRFKELIVLARRSDTATERYLHYQSAVDLYVDDFLKEDLFEEWTISERELLKDACLEALEFIAGEELRTERYDDAAMTARRIIASDSTSERGYEILLRSLASRGRMTDLRNAVAECIRSYSNELGISPPARLMGLAQELDGHMLFMVRG
jgi:two-component SAPR family response regulator/tetratricopeptide (TPR) repeat protein